MANKRKSGYKNWLRSNQSQIPKSTRRRMQSRKEGIQIPNTVITDDTLCEEEEQIYDMGDINMIESMGDNDDEASDGENIDILNHNGNPQTSKKKLSK
ncbi:hypothetical protein JTE90_025531 [Oedothorax gibbosus]|uniref:Uncharacterized protein n=1 Tax=Oedothorax gibbosus TaxID=931172 RepID=A0AAV6TWQ3_9ARAC|nr:hypothetical protein JTE90_025531 [Oedothorax gibbosus]